MNQEQWTAVDEYIADLLVAPDPALDHALAASDAAGLPDIAVAPNQGKMLYLLAKIHGACRILEIGTLGGYSTIWLARALPEDGALVTLEYEEKHAQVARENIARAGLSDRVEVRVGPALDTLAVLGHQEVAPFDLAFIDADKPNNPGYLTWALKLVRPGGVIIVDNVIRNGKVADATSTDPAVQGTRELARMLSEEKRATATMVQTVGSKGYDGFALIRVEE
ncbi:O-methyltransferase [Actinophytocola xanthii]|uniref:Methyltransferase n=1 Tax=Actinophytocola xanthii TaxID=1912961 RepID=A0A1Q8CTX0_9PSEU|nr:O-methyltransferase [Actinophytocola xanthii]OLF17807.1 methyltransferase [Actinophytocola xanthii]